MKKRIAIIDMGTNTFNLLVVDASNDELDWVHRSKIAVKIGEGSFKNKVLSGEAMERAELTVNSFFNTIGELSTEEVACIATSAIRDAKNGKEFCDRLNKKFGVEIQVIDGKREAELIYKAVKYSGVLLRKGTCLVMDIGGGSVEFIICDQQEENYFFSFNVGVSHLLEKFTPSDPITNQQVSQIKAHIKSELKMLWDAVDMKSPGFLIGSSGTFDSMCEMVARAKGRKVVNSFYNELLIEDYQKIVEKIIVSTKNERYDMPGLLSMRVEFIVMGVILIDTVLEETGIDKLWQCEYSLKEGVIVDMLE